MPSSNLANISIPHGSILGLSYCGMHDSAIAIVSPNGEPLFALSLERVSRVKMDGRWPEKLLSELPWDRISTVAISTNKEFLKPASDVSKLHPLELSTPHLIDVKHDPVFYEHLKTIPCEVEYVCHRLSHVSSSFWGSKFDDSLCLNYDGGMANDPWFGGVYKANRKDGISVLDQFSAARYAKVTLLYQVITAYLGFTPNKHEGKVTGLAAYGKPQEYCLRVFNQWLLQDFLSLENTLRWEFPYNEKINARIVSNGSSLENFCEPLNQFSAKDIAASLQYFSERHVIEIIQNARKIGWDSPNLCLSGGLFANVKINQRVAELGFRKVFIAPPMTDDGTALGAAWHVASRNMDFNPKPFSTMYLGPAFESSQALDLIQSGDILVEKPENIPEYLANLLANGYVVAMFQGAMEFGPRSLGNRSIIASAFDPKINESLNKRLNRTEFMPFAPICRAEDANEFFKNLDVVEHATHFMTVTLDCTESLKKACPAVVHVDGTARPQLVTAQENPMMHSIIGEYKKVSGRPALVNTSFNIHEEPIVCTPEDALKGFFEAALDYLYIEGVGVIPLKGNENISIRYLQDKLKKPSEKLKELNEINISLKKDLTDSLQGLEEKEAVIRGLDSALKIYRESECS